MSFDKCSTRMEQHLVAARLGVFTAMKNSDSDAVDCDCMW